MDNVRLLCAYGLRMPEVVVYDAVGRRMETELAGGAPAYQFYVSVYGVYFVRIGEMPDRRVGEV